MGSGTSSVVRALLIHDEDGPGPLQPVLFVGGFFSQAGGLPVGRLAKWDGAAWSAAAPAPGFNSQVSALATYDEDGIGPNPPRLFAAGFFGSVAGVPARRIARWDGVTWSEVGTGIGSFPDDTVTSLQVFDPDGPAGPERAVLVAGGFFTHAGGQPAENIAYWDGAAWAQLGSGTTGTVTSLGLFDEDGPGPNPARLFVGGPAGVVGGNSGIVRWDGVNFSSVGGGTNAYVDDMVVWDDDGPGPNPPALFVGGGFSTAGGQPAANVAKWDGTSWSPLGTGVNSNVLGLTVFDEDGAGPGLPALYAAGNFSHAGALLVNQVARWNGAAWSSLDGGADSQVSVLLGVDAGIGTGVPTMYAGGFFTQAGGIAVTRMGAWVGCAPCPADFNLDGVVTTADISAFLGAWFNDLALGTLTADFNGDGVIGTGDVTLFLGAWFAALQGC
ncbi:MAG TPA: GC-type dockerin domain-anchored protein [Phycisphaerales bacterium]|nr:GC-type dockerin domain-anchored protein [Phycisphaerales bacterium]